MNIRGLKHTSRGFHSRPKFFLLKSLTILAAVFFIASLLYFFASVTDFPKSFSRARELHFKGNLRDAKFPWNKLCFGPASEKLKLAVFSKTRPIGSAPGGMEHHASTLYNALAARGIEIHVFSAPSDRRPHKDIEVAHLDP